MAAVALEAFLVPNRIIDGGVVGLSIVLNKLTPAPLGAIILVLNAPFLVASLRQIGRNFLFLSLYAVASLSLWVSVGPLRNITGDLFLATVFGGIVLGLGVGLIIRNGGCLDGAEIVSILLNKRLPFSVGEILMTINILVFAVAGFVFGLDRALYSAATYLIAYKVIDLIVEGIDESKAMFIISDRTDDIAQAIMNLRKGGVTILNGSGGYSKEDKRIIYVIVSRLEIAKFKNLVRSMDEEAFITIHNVHEVIGKNLES